MSKKSISPHQEMLAARRKRDADILRRAKRKETHESIAEVMGMTRQRVGQIIRASKQESQA